MAPSDVKVLGLRPSPFVNRVQMALNLKSVDYENVEENLANKSELLLKSNPVFKKVPVLIHADKPISESHVIVQYIDEVWSNGPSILPSDPYDRAIARFWTALLDEKELPLMRQLTTAQNEEKEALLNQIVEHLVLLDEVFVKSSKGKAFFGGDTIGYLDIGLGCFLGWFRVVEILNQKKLIDESNTPNLVGWAERFLSHDAIKTVAPDPQELLEFLSQARQKAAASS